MELWEVYILFSDSQCGSLFYFLLRAAAPSAVVPLMPSNSFCSRQSCHENEPNMTLLFHDKGFIVLQLVVIGDFQNLSMLATIWSVVVIPLGDCNFHVQLGFLWSDP